MDNDTIPEVADPRLHARTPPEELLALRRTLEESPVFTALLDAIPDPVLVLDRHRQIVFANRSLGDCAASAAPGEMCGMRPGEALGCQVAAAHNDNCGVASACKACAAMQGILASQSGRRSTGTLRIKRKDGRPTLDLAISAAPFLWNNRLLTILVLRDKHGEHSRADMDRIFFHDILNTASAAHALAELIRDEGADRETLDTLSAATGELLAELKLQRLFLEGNPPLQPSAVDTLDILRRTVQMLARQPCATGKYIAIADDSTDNTIRTLAPVLSRVLTNMFKNAVEATPKGGTVLVGCSTGSDSVAFWCENPGAIPPLIRAKILSGLPCDTGDGHGLGTYSIRLLAEHFLHGTVHFLASGPDATRVVLTLPGPLQPASNVHSVASLS